MTGQRNFDAMAAAWDENPHRVKLAGEIATAIARSQPLSRTWDAMDFGCGTGLVTLNLAPLLGSIAGVDSSPKMLERLAAKAREQGYANVKVELFNPEKGELSGRRYHLIASAMTMHHIPEIVPLLTRLRNLLHPGGRIAIADLETEDGSFHADPTGVFHHGFSHEEFTGMLGQSGFTDVTISRVAEIDRGNRVYLVFLATATAPEHLP